MLLARPLPAAADALPAQTRERLNAVVDMVLHGAQDLVVYAFGLVGVEYRYGGEGPGSGLDCGGLVRHVFQQVAGVLQALVSSAAAAPLVPAGAAEHP